jgi:hypothetical protein
MHSSAQQAVAVAAAVTTVTFLQMLLLATSALTVLPDGTSLQRQHTNSSGQPSAHCPMPAEDAVLCPCSPPAAPKQVEQAAARAVLLNN